ncbi:MAG: phosphate acyltransferase PlsX [Christensenellaceae bacterium]|jgi:glycerol-3-phosphate acyltransferase PlsX
MYHIIVDAMGGDHAPEAVIAGVAQAINELSDVKITLVGKEEVISPFLAQHETDKARIAIVDAREEIEMAESPTKAIRSKKDSSMVVGMELVAAGKGDVFVTAGSTGAAVAGGTLIVRRAPGVARPALAPVLPGANGGVLLIDCGANVDVRPAYLAQFGVMGSIYMQTVMGIENPRVGLINNGAEEEKGNALTKEAYQLLREQEINFVGNVEGRDILAGGCDVVVCDGFTGNVLMKFMEGCAKLLMGMIKDEMMSSFRTKIGAALALPAFKNVAKQMDYTEYGGALLLGTKAGLIKAHGSSNAKAIASTIRQARDFAAKGVVAKITENLASRVEEA